MVNSQPEGFLAVPTTGKGPGVLVLHAWWGLNQTIKDFCSRLAEAGFTAFAPDLYHGQIATTIPEAEGLSQALFAKNAQARAEVAAAAAYLNERAGDSADGIVVIGFSLGAYYALDLSAAANAEQVRSVVVYYGTGPDDFSKSKAEYLGHFAEKDPFEPAENVAALKDSLQRAGRPATLYTYAGTGHWFCEPDRTDAYNEAAANLAWERTLAFLKNSLG